MKLFKNIFAWIMIILLGIVYMIDRAILIFLPWIEVKSIQDWMPKTTKFDEIKKQFPTFTDETIEEIKKTREYGITLNKITFTRVTISVFIAMCVYIIFR